MLELYYKAPEDPEREKSIIEFVASHGGKMDFRESATNHSDTIVLTFEFADLLSAESAANALRDRGEHIEGPGAYG